MLWFVIIAAVATLVVFVLVEVRSWKKPSRLADSFGGYTTPGVTAAGNDMAPRGLPKRKP